jgi:hypothetical protein
MKTNEELERIARDIWPAGADAIKNDADGERAHDAVMQAAEDYALSPEEIETLWTIVNYGEADPPRTSPEERKALIWAIEKKQPLPKPEERN